MIPFRSCMLLHQKIAGLHMHLILSAFPVQAHQQRIMELEHQLQETSTRLQASDAVRMAAEQRVQELTVELENNASAICLLCRKTGLWCGDAWIADACRN